MIRALWLLPLTLFLALAGCQETRRDPVAETVAEIPEGATAVTVIGAIHGQHVSSEKYSLEKLEKAIRQYNPTMVMIELPPESYVVAAKNFRENGRVEESRADDFPELTEVIFPLSQELGFTMIPVAAWSPEIASDRREKLAEIKDDPSRRAEWRRYQSAIADYQQAVRSRSDDPFFIHGDDYDAAVKKRQEAYEQLFGPDLGAGGWAAINEAHFARIADTLDRISGHEQRILILFGAWHKYWFLEKLEARSDVVLIDAALLFEDDGRVLPIQR